MMIHYLIERVTIDEEVMVSVDEDSNERFSW